MKKNYAHNVILRNIEDFADKKIVLINPEDLFAVAELSQFFTSVCVVSMDFALHKSLKEQGIEVFDFDSMDKIPQEFTTCILFWSKVKEESWQYLSYLSEKDFELFLVGGNKSGIKQAQKKLEEMGQPVYKLYSANHSQVLKLDKFAHKIPRLEHKKFNLGDLQIFTEIGVFSSGRLDKGSEFLLDYLAKNPIALKHKVLDLGSGSGVLGAWLLKNKQAEFVLGADANLAAVKSTERTFKENSLNGKAIASDVFSEVEDKDFDLIITNPPFHENFATSSRFMQEFFAGAKKSMALNGEIILVANIFLPYGKYFADNFKNWRELSSNSSYRIFWAKK